MSLYCDCNYDDHDWFYEPQDVTPLNTKRSRTCCSCRERIAVGDDAMAFRRWRYPNYDSVAERIYGECGEEPLTTWYMCDRCAGLYESLKDLGFCDLLQQNMVDVCKEYADMQRYAGVFRGQMIIAKAKGEPV